MAVIFLFVVLLSDCNSSYLAAEGFGQLVNEFNNSGIFIGCRVGLNVVLKLFNKFIRAFIAGAENNRCLNNKASHGVGNACYRNLKNGRVLKHNAFNFKGSDSVARSIDNVIVSADIHKSTLFITVGKVARVEESASVGFSSFFLAEVIA